MKRFFVGISAAFVLAALVLACGTPGAGRLSMTPGTFRATTVSYAAALTVEVRTSADAITSVRVVNHGDTPGVADPAIALIPAQIVEHQTLAVDIVTGVTVTSLAIINAVEDALRQAGADVTALYRPIRRPRVRDQTMTADVIIVGGGGAGLSAAVEAAAAGASVILVEKAGFLGGNSIVVGGIVNAPNTRQQITHGVGTGGQESLVMAALAAAPINAEHRAMQDTVRREFEEHRRRADGRIFDSPAWFALQTWEAGDRLAFLNMVYIMTSRVRDAIEWLESKGMEFQDRISQGAGSLYPRTLTAVLPNGVGFINALLAGLEGRPNYQYLMETRATSLITQGGRVVGVNAVNNHTGQRITLRANNGVILATGGFAGNVEMRRRYAEGDFWTYLGPTVVTSNVGTVTGDGIIMAREVGAALNKMDQIQLLHICNPVTGSTGDIAAPIGLAGYLYVNREGNRFIREDGRRDIISQAVLAQPGRVMYLIQSADIIRDPHTTYTLDNRRLSYMLENNISGWVTAPTLRDLASVLGMPYANLSRTIANYNAIVDAGGNLDEFGRVVFTHRIANGPWYAFPRAPATHHTMGGVLIDEHTRVLREDRSVIPGLYAAGEVTGVVHGSNRLGGSAVAEFLVFGRIAGQNAAARR